MPLYIPDNNTSVHSNLGLQMNWKYIVSYFFLEWQTTGFIKLLPCQGSVMVWHQGCHLRAFTPPYGVWIKAWLLRNISFRCGTLCKRSPVLAFVKMVTPLVNDGSGVQNWDKMSILHIMRAIMCIVFSASVCLDYAAPNNFFYLCTNRR